MLHKHCSLTKWEIFEYTLPQITSLLKNAKKYIQFEIETTMTPFKAFFGSGEKSDAKEITEDDIEYLEQMAQTF